MTRLAAGPLQAELAGGDLLSVVSLRLDGRELLVAPEALPAAYRVHGRRAGLTLLHPWANRLSAATWSAAGRGARVPADDPAVTRDPAGLPIHGLAPAGAWSLPAQPPEPGRLQVETRFAGHPAFPFAHLLRVDLHLTPDALAVTAVLTAAEAPVPVAFGWHPYLHPGGRREEWVLELPEHEWVALDDSGLPAGAVKPRPAERAPLGERTFDDALALPEAAVLSVAGESARIALFCESGYPVGQLFAPGDVDVISLEPMTAPVDALRSGHGLRLVAPGESFTAAFRLEVGPAAGG